MPCRRACCRPEFEQVHLNVSQDAALYCERLDVFR